MKTTPSIQLDSSRLHRAKGLFVLGESTDILLTSLEGLGAELSSRWMSIGQGQKLGHAIGDYPKNVKALSDAISYASERLTEVLVRQQEIGWKKEVLAYEKNPDVFAQASDPQFLSWRMFMGLAIKDFHVDIGSLMDALSPVVIKAESKLKSKDKNNSTGWADIQEDGSKRSDDFRQQLPRDLLEIVDSTNRWWPAIKEVRNLLVHRKHDRIIFGHSEDGLLFQVYDQSRRPKIIFPSVLYRQGDNVVDFDFYSAFILAEIVILFDDLGKVIAPKIQVSNNNIAQMCIRIVEKPFAQSIERLIQAAG